MIKLSFSTLMRIATLISVSALAGCGGGASTVNPLSPSRVIAIGDAYNAVDATGSGTFTVRNGATDNTVAGRIAAKYGITLNGATGAPLDSTGGFSYASGTNGKAVDVQNQVGLFLADVSNSVGPKDLIIISVGSQDIVAQAPTNNTAALAAAANTVKNAVQSLTNAGAKYVLIVLPINMARTPWGLGGAGGLVTTDSIRALSYDTGTQCLSFSCQLATKLNAAYPATTNHQPILLADLMSYANLFTGTTPDTYLTYGVTNPNTAACNAGGTSGCATNVVNANYATYIFADTLNLTPFGNALLADQIYNVNFYRAAWR